MGFHDTVTSHVLTAQFSTKKSVSSDRVMKEGDTVLKTCVNKPFSIFFAVTSVDVADYAGQSS